MKRLLGWIGFTALALAAGPAFSQQKITVGVSLPQDDNPFYIAMKRGIGGDLGAVRRSVVLSLALTALWLLGCF